MHDMTDAAEERAVALDGDVAAATAALADVRCKWTAELDQERDKNAQTAAAAATTIQQLQEAYATAITDAEAAAATAASAATVRDVAAAAELQQVCSATPCDASSCCTRGPERVHKSYHSCAM
jgi:hypothetical protein